MVPGSLCEHNFDPASTRLAYLLSWLRLLLYQLFGRRWKRRIHHLSGKRQGVMRWHRLLIKYLLLHNLHG